MPRQVLAWQCRYCQCIKKSEKIAVRHEKACTSNPDSRNCMFCVHSYRGVAFFKDEKPKMSCAKRDCDCSRAISAECPLFIRKDTE